MPSNRTIRPPRPLIPGRKLDVKLGGLDPDMEYVYQELARLSNLAAQIGPITLPTAGYSANDLLVFSGGAWTAVSKFDLLGLTDLTDVALTGPVTNQALLFIGGQWKNSSLTEILNLNDLADATITSPANGEVLTYASGQWVNQAGGGATTLDDLSDVDVSLAVDGDFLIFSSGTSEWTAANWTTRDFGLGAAPTVAKFELNSMNATDRGMVLRGTTGQTAAMLQVRDISDALTFEVLVGAIGAFGATPVGQQTIAGAATDLATAITLVNGIRTALRNFGWCI